MEIQGLTNAQNTHHQHGVPSHFNLSSSGTTIGTVFEHISPKNDDGFGPGSDSNNNKAESSPLRLLLQNGSGSHLHEKQIESNGALVHQVQAGDTEFCNLNMLKEREYGELELPPDFVRMKYGEDENEDGVLQMALPLFDGEEEVLTEQCERLQPDAVAGTRGTCSKPKDSTVNSSGGKNQKGIYVVLNIVQEKEERQRRKREAQENLTDSSASSEAPPVQTAHHITDSHQKLSFKQKSYPATRFDVFPSNSMLMNDSGVRRGGQEADTYGMALERDGQLELDSIEQQTDCKNVVPDNTLLEYEEDLVNLTNGGLVTGLSPETFSGTIMINNQSIVVTIENGILTLAAPPDGYTYKEDGVMSIKEHLGVKENEDIVLLNYEVGGKSLEKMTGEDRMDVSDSEELTLADDGSLSELGSAPDPSVKHEEESRCKGENPKDPTEDEQQSVGLVPPAGSGKKAGVVSYRCPQSGCTCVFDTRQKLKMHLVFHTEDQRPFKCTVEGCGWSFTTSYKLKRHLQSHDKLRPYACEWENCGRRFTTVYNLKAHARAHEQENAFPCELCGERFRSATRLTNHHRTHFEPERPHKCEFPGCEKAFITFSALFSHNRTHFRETSQFTCTYPGCEKRYDKACRLKIHLRSHTGERPFVCDFESCASTFTSMSKLLRHKRKHDDDRRFTCPEEGCGKSFTRAEHLKGHSITHLGTKPFECPVEGCNAKFSARSSLYIHSKKHRQDGLCLRSRCPVAGCTKHFSSRSSLKSHMHKHHNLSPDVLNHLENTATLTPSCELTSAAQTATAPSSVGAELSSLDLSILFSNVSSGASAIAAGPTTQPGPGSFTMDMALVGSGILTIDPASVGSALGSAKPVDPLILAAGGDLGAHVLDTGGGAVLQPAALHLDDVQTVNPEALGALTALAIQSTIATEHLQGLSSSSALTAETPSSSLNPSLSSSLSSSLGPSLSSALVSSLASTAGPELLSTQEKADIGGNETSVGPLLSEVAVLSQQENGKVVSQFVFPSIKASFGGQKETELPAVTPCLFMESSGSARTDYRAIQLAKRKKQKGSAASAATAGTTLRKPKGGKISSAAAVSVPVGARFGEGTATTAGLTIRDPVTGAQYVQIQLLQDDPSTDGDLAFQLTSQTSSSHSQLTVDLPVNILQEPSAMTEDDNGSDNSQFTGSTINLQDLE